MALSTWSCSACTFENKSTTSQCDACSTSRYPYNHSASYTHRNTENNSDDDDDAANASHGISAPGGEWHCDLCNQSNAAHPDKCAVCLNHRSPIFSASQVQDLNDFASLQFHTTLSPSQSAPNPIVSNISMYNTFNDSHSNNNNSNNRNSTNSNQPHIGHSNNSSSHNNSHHAHSHSVSLSTNNRNTDLFDLYTNKKKAALLPIDIQISSGKRPKLGPEPLKIHYDEEFNLSTSPSPSSSLSSIVQQRTQSQSFSIYQPPSLATNPNARKKSSPLPRRVHFFDKTDEFSSPSPPPHTMQTTSHSLSDNNANDNHGQTEKKKHSKKRKKTSKSKPSTAGNCVNDDSELPLNAKLVRKYSDPKKQSTTTLLIVPPQKLDDCSLRQLEESMHTIDQKIIEILRQRHTNNDYYRHIVHKAQQLPENTDLIKKRMSSPTDNLNMHANRRNIKFLTCVACRNQMVHTKCPDARSANIKCYECGISISTLGMEYYHCPNVKMAVHREIGRDLCCICGVKQIIKPCKNDHDSNQSVSCTNNTETDEQDGVIDSNQSTDDGGGTTMGKNEDGLLLDEEEQMISYENFLKYETYKFEQIIPIILTITSLADFEFIYQQIYYQILHQHNDDADIMHLLHSNSNMLAKQLAEIDTDITRSKSNKNDIQNECAAISNDITKVNAEITALMKKINLLTQKKQRLQTQMQGIFDVLNEMNEHEHQLEIMSSKTNLYKEKIDQRIKYIENYNDKVNMLQCLLKQKRQTLSGKWKLWSTKQILINLKHYLKLNRLSLNSLGQIFHEFQTRGITGKDLPNLNELTFKMMNITHAYDQKVLLMWIRHITDHQEQSPSLGANYNHSQHKTTQTVTNSKPPAINLDIDDDNDVKVQVDEEEDDEDEDSKMDISTENSPPIATTQEKRSQTSLLCAVCMHNQVNVILSPCGHICLCHQCTQKMSKQKCPMCRADITEIRNCFFAAR